MPGLPVATTPLPAESSPLRWRTVGRPGARRRIVGPLRQRRRYRSPRRDPGLRAADRVGPGAWRSESVDTVLVPWAPQRRTAAGPGAESSAPGPALGGRTWARTVGPAEAARRGSLRGSTQETDRAACPRGDAGHPVGTIAARALISRLSLARIIRDSGSLRALAANAAGMCTVCTGPGLRVWRLLLGHGIW